MSSLSSHHHLGPVASAILIYGFGVVVFALMFIYVWRRRAHELRDAKAAEAAADADVEWKPGPVVLFGAVEYAQGASAAVRVDVDQEGSEYENSGVWSHSWKESNRRVHVEPFYLKVFPDKRIRVEPTRDVYLVDEMDGMIRVDLKSRTRFAQLTPDEHIYAVGELVRAHDPEGAGASGGYRSSRDAFVLRPRAGESMLLSSEPMGKRYRARAEFYASTMAWFVGACIVFHLAVMNYHLRQLTGETMIATITKLDHYTTTDDEGDSTDHYRVIAKLPSGKEVRDHVDFSDFMALKQGQQVPFVCVAGGSSSSSTIGPDLTAHFSALGVVPLAWLVWAVFRGSERDRKPWYESKVVDSDSGKLEESLMRDRRVAAKASEDAAS